MRPCGAIANVAVEDINVQHVTRWQRELKDRLALTPSGQPTDHKINAMTVRGALKMLRTALRDAHIEGLLEGVNPAVVARPPRVARYRRPDLTESEIKRLFLALHNDELRALWWTLTNLGRRVGETLAIRLEDFKPDDGVIEMEHSLTRGNRQYILGRGKPHEPRATPSMYVVELLQQHIKRRDALKLAKADRWIETPFLFTTTVGTPMNASRVWTRFQRIRKQARVPHLRVHDLRTYCATFLLEETTDLRMVQAYIGWSTLEMAGHYAGVSMARRAALGEVLDRRIRSYVDGGGDRSSVSNGVSGGSDTQDSAVVEPVSNGNPATDGSDIEPMTIGFGVRGSIVPGSVSDPITWFEVRPRVPEASSDAARCPMMGCQGECQDALPRPYHRTRILTVIQTHPILGPALRTIERAEADPLVRKQLRVGVARYLWWCAAHRLDPTFADERQLAFAFEAGSDSVSYRRQLRSYARRFVEEVIEHARPREARDGSAIGVRHRPTRSSAKAPAPPTKVVTLGRAGPPEI